MKGTEINLASREVARMARLLVNFHRETSLLVLQRFDAETRSQVQDQIEELQLLGCHSDERSLAEFADFLYFDPKPMAGSMSSIKKPRLAPAVIPAKEISFEEIVHLDERSLDQLLKAASPELTVRVLNCSPPSFVNRVLERLSHDDAAHVSQQLEKHREVDFSELQQVHQMYCDLAKNLVEQGFISL